MTPTQARIFDLVQRAGANGIDRRDLKEIMAINTNTLAQHVFYLNQRIADEGYQINGRTVARLIKI